MSKPRLPLKYAYDTLYYEQKTDGKNEYILRIKKYRYEYKFPLITVSVTAFPLQDNFDDVSLSVSDVLTVEERVKSSLSLDEMKQALYQLFSTRFLQQSFVID